MRAPADVYLFTSDLCISMNALGFSSKRAIPLRDIYGVMKREELPCDEGITVTVEVQCKSLSIALSMQSEDWMAAAQVRMPLFLESR